MIHKYSQLLLFIACICFIPVTNSLGAVPTYAVGDAILPSNKLFKWQVSGPFKTTTWERLNIYNDRGMNQHDAIASRLASYCGAQNVDADGTSCRPLIAAISNYTDPVTLFETDIIVATVPDQYGDYQFVSYQYPVVLAPEQYITMVHINGIRTTRDEAIESTDTLRANVKKTTFQYAPSSSVHMSVTVPIPIRCILSYNIGNTFFNLTFMKAVENDADRAFVMSQAMQSSNFTGLDPTTAAAMQADYIQQSEDTLTALTTSMAIGSISQDVKNWMTAGPVILVPHSQGNLYANSVFLAVTGNIAPNPNLSIVGVANTASYVAGDPNAVADKSYITLSNDHAVGLLSAGFSVLPPTLTATDTVPGQYLNHNFINVYMNSAYIALEPIMTLISAKVSVVLNGIYGDVQN